MVFVEINTVMMHTTGITTTTRMLTVFPDSTMSVTHMTTKSTPTSLAESMEIIIPGSPNSSDTTKPTHQEMFEVLSPRSDVSQLDESVKTYDTGYEGEDKTTFDESSLIEDDVSKSKKKKKKKQKLKEITVDDQSSIDPKSSDFVPSEGADESTDLIEKHKTPKSKKPGKKSKKENLKEHQAKSFEEEVLEGSIKDISEESAKEGIVKIVEESVPARPSSEVKEFQSTNVLTSVPVLEVLSTQSESVQTIPAETEKPVETVETSMQAIQDTQEVFAQTSTPEMSSIEACIQTIPEELVPTVEEGAQTITPKAQSPVETADSTIQTVNELVPLKQEEEIQTDEVKFGSLNNVDSGMQTVEEVRPIFLEETVQTSPEPDKVQMSSQVDREDLIPTEDEESQTAELAVKTNDLSTQIISSDLIPTHDESVQTTADEKTSPVKTSEVAAVEENPAVTEAADKNESKKPDVLATQESESTTKESTPQDESKPLTTKTVQTTDSMSQTKPLKFKRDSESTESSVSTGEPFKIEIEATVSYGRDTDTETATPDDSSKSEEKSLQVCAPSPESTDTGSDVSSWASHEARVDSLKPKKDKKSKQRKRVTDDKEIVPARDVKGVSNQELSDKRGSKRPDVKAKVKFDVDEHSSSLNPELVAEISQNNSASALFIQAEMKEKSSSKTSKDKIAPGFSQTVELEMTSNQDQKVENRLTEDKKPKKDRKIRRRTDTKALPEASKFLGPEELRGEHSPGPPERGEDSQFKTEYDTNFKPTTLSCKTNIASPTKALSVKGTLSTPRETRDISFTSSDDKIDIEFMLHENPDKLSLDVRGEVEINGSQLQPPVREKPTSPDDFKKEVKLFIDYETTESSTTPTPHGSQVLEGDSNVKNKSKNKTKRISNKDQVDNINKTTDVPSNKILDDVDSLDKKDLPKGTVECLDIKWKQVGDLITERVKQAQFPTTTTHMTYLTSLQRSDISPEERTHLMEDNLSNLQDAIKTQDVIVIQQTIIISVETISTWLETIEYKIQRTKQSSLHGTVPEQRLAELSCLQEEISQVSKGVNTLDDIVAQAGAGMCGQEAEKNMRQVISVLQRQAAAVEETAKTTRNLADKDLARWEEFLNGVNNINVLVEQLRAELQELVEDQNTAALEKLKKLESLETINRGHKVKCGLLLISAHRLLRNFPGREIPAETFTTQDTTQAIEHNINTEREKLLQLIALADEYEQTLKDFEQITDVAEALVDGPVVVNNLQHLQEEMQKHRKFFVNLSHCRGILESLEGNLDSETRAQHSSLHNELHRRASVILDKAAGRAQQMAMAASRWTVLEQGMKEERGWLQVANQRVPDLSSVTTSDYNQYISLYQSLSSDLDKHVARMSQLVCVAHGLQGLVQSESCASYDDHYAAVLALQSEVNSELNRLLSFRDSWTVYDLLSDKLDAWIKSVNIDSAPNNMRQFWELKAQFELHKHVRDDAATNMNAALGVIPVADETVQRQLHAQLMQKWKAVEAGLEGMQTEALENFNTSSGSVEEKLNRLKEELTELATLLADMHGVIKTEEELQLYIERLQVMRASVDHIMEQLGCLGLLSAAESDRVSALLGDARVLELSLREELEGASTLRDRLTAIRRGTARVRRDQQRAASVLDQCEASVNQNQDSVQQALTNCQGVADNLQEQWGELMALRQLLHTLPSRLRLSMSPVRVEREITQLIDNHADLTERCKTLYNVLAQRLTLWRRFYSQLELVRQSVQETDYMMEILAVQGQVDYERLVKATERLEGLSESLEERESQLEGLRLAAEPLQSSCSPEVAREIEEAVTEAVTAWEDTVASLQGLCDRYQHAVQLWKQYRDASQTIQQWADKAADTVETLEPQQAVSHVKVCQEDLTAHQERLAELRSLVAQIAADVGLDPESLLAGEVAALGHKLEDVRESLAVLAETVESKAQDQQLCGDDLLQAKTFLNTVQKSLEAVDSSGKGDTLEQLSALRNHLIALGKTDGQIQVLRDKSADMPPGKQDISVIDILQLWQQVFRETFQQYHRLSARLVRDQDGLAALKLWQEYLLHVQAFLTTAIPDDYTALSEHQNLCQVHQNLLSSQQSLLLNKSEADSTMELSVAEQFNSLTNLHNEILARIMDREAQVRNRMKIWDQYRNDHKTLLAWLREVEKEKSRLRLRYVHMRMIPKTIQKIEALIDKLPSGEARAEKLSGQLPQLCHFCDEKLATSIKLEHTAIVDKISSIRAALQTWFGFLLGLQELTGRYEREVESVQKSFSEVHVALESETSEGSSTCVPASFHHIQQRLEVIKREQSRVSELAKDLELLVVTQDQLKESLNPTDMKTVNQRVWLLGQQHGDLEQQLAMMCYQLEDKLRLGQMFDKRQERFLTWAGQVERRLAGLATSTSEPQDVLRRLETELEAEVVLRRREAEWLRLTGAELVAAEGLDVTTRRADLKAKTAAVTEAWERVQQMTSARAHKLRQIIEGMKSLEKRLEELNGWLHSVEVQLATPIILEQCTEAGLNKCLTHHNILTKDIEQHSGDVGDVLNHCELLLSDCDSANVQLNTDGISTAMQLLERRWKNVCVEVAERKSKLMRTWRLLQEVLRLCAEQTEWLQLQTNTLDRVCSQSSSPHLQELPALIDTAEKVGVEVKCRKPALDLLQSSYTTLATQSSLENLTGDVRQQIGAWSLLSARAEEQLSILRAAQDQWHAFIDTQAAAVLALTDVDVQLTQVAVLDTGDDSNLDTHKNKLKKLLALKKQLDGHGKLLGRADLLGLEVMKSCASEDVARVQEKVDEYQHLWKDISERLQLLIETCKDECRKRNVVNEEVQVETLRFETDSSVQVNTLPAPLLRRDAYVYELQTAIRECNANMDTLETFDKLTTQNAAKCMAACQSSIDLVRHLSGLLVEQCGMTAEEACHSDVETLTQRYQELLARKQAAEREQREARSGLEENYTFYCIHESGRFTCPLCTRRNWKQLDNDIWRLQKWLDFAEGVQASQRSPPKNINQVEDVIQDQKEFVLDLDSHKSLVVSLNVVGKHLAEHTEDEQKAKEATAKLAEINCRWDAVCKAAADWDSKLQTALFQNPELNETVEELLQWLEQTEVAIQQMEPVDVADGLDIIESKYNKIKDLRHDLEVFEPRVLSLQEAVSHVLRSRSSDTRAQGTHVDTCERVSQLRLRLQSLTRVTGSYLLKLGTVLGKDPSLIPHASLATLSHELLDQASGGNISSRSSTDQLHSNSEGIVDTSVLARGYRFLGRVVRASLPIQALMLVMLGVATLVPITEEDFACSISRTLGPTLRFANGPPPM